MTDELSKHAARVKFTTAALTHSLSRHTRLKIFTLGAFTCDTTGDCCFSPHQCLLLANTLGQGRKVAMRVPSQFTASFDQYIHSCRASWVDIIINLGCKSGPIHGHDVPHSDVNDEHDLVPVRYSTDVAGFMHKCRFGTQRLYSRIVNRSRNDCTHGCIGIRQSCTFSRGR